MGTTRVYVLVLLPKKEVSHLVVSVIFSLLVPFALLHLHILAIGKQCRKRNKISLAKAREEALP